MASATQSDGSSRSPVELMVQLSALMFLLFWSIGSWVVTVKTFIATNTEQEGEAIFSAGFIGYSATSAAIGALLAPTLAGWLSDRFVAAERLLTILQFGASAALWMMHESTSQTAFYVGMLIYFQMLSPSVVLANAICFRKLADRDREFPIVRLFGTIGWIAAGLFVGIVCRWWFEENIEPTRLPILLAAGSHAALALYTLTLPSQRPIRTHPRTNKPRGGLLRNGPLLLFLFISLLAAVMSQAYDVSNVFLNQQGYEAAAATLTLGQLTEVGCLFAMPWLRSLMRLKTMFLIGVLAWGLRYLLLALGSCDIPTALAAGAIVSAIMVHGPAYAFVYLVGQMYVDRLVDPSNRGVAQGLHAVATAGFGHLLGSGLTGWSQAAFLTPVGVSPPPYDWISFWLTPVVLSLVTAALFAVTFAEIEPEETTTSPDATPSDRSLIETLPPETTPWGNAP